MDKFKVFSSLIGVSGYHLEKLENKVNKFLQSSEINVMDVKVTIQSDSIVIYIIKYESIKDITERFQDAINLIKLDIQNIKTHMNFNKKWNSGNG